MQKSTLVSDLHVANICPFPFMDSQVNANPSVSFVHHLVKTVTNDPVPLDSAWTCHGFVGG